MSRIGSYNGMRSVSRFLHIGHSVSYGLHDSVVTPRRRTCGDSDYQIHLGPEVDMVACLCDWSFDRELPRLTINRNVHKAIERRRNILLGNSMSLQSKRQISKAAVVRLLIGITQTESVFRARRHDEVVSSHGVFDDRKERVTAIAVELVAGGQVDLPGVVECPAI